MARRKGKRRRRKGAGGVRKRTDGRWEATIVTGQTRDGRTQRKSIYGRTKREVMEKLAELKAAPTRSVVVPELAAVDMPSITLEEASERWLASRGNVMADTLYSYSQEIGPLLDLLGSVDLAALKARHVRSAYIQLANDGYSVRAQKRAAMHLRAILRLAVQDEYVHRSVADGVKISAPRVPTTATVWTPAEAKRFLHVAKHDRFDVLFQLLLTLGLRSGEALGLAWRYVDLTVPALTVRYALRRKNRGSRMEIGEVKTSSSRRTLHLPGDLASTLTTHRVAARNARSQQGRGWSDDALVFSTRTGTPISPSNVRRSLKRLSAAADVRSIRVHDLRHTHASLALAAGVPVEIVSRRLGHASIAITLDLYRHVYEPEMRAAALSLDELLNK